MVRFLVIVVNLTCVTIVISEVGRCSPSTPSFFQNDTIFQRAVRNFSATEPPVGGNAKHTKLSMERCSNSSKGWFSLNQSCHPTLGTCGRGLWGVKEIVASLQDCQWKQPVLIISDSITATGRHCSFEDCGHELVNNASSETPWKSTTYRDQSQRNHISHFILAAFQALIIPVQHFLVSSTKDKNLQTHLEEIIWTSYSSRGVRHFVWISPRPWKILDAAETVFRRHQRGRGALMVHKALFILFGVSNDSILTATSSSIRPSVTPLPSHLLNCPSCKSLLLKETEKHLSSCVFDNVLFLSSPNYRDVNNSLDNFCFPNLPHTLMWRNNRTREFETIPKFDKKSLHNTFSRPNRQHSSKRYMERNCKLFPNIRTIMNGRPLILLCKEWNNRVTFHMDNGSVKYSGFLYELADVLSTSMNFTFTLQPDPEVSRNMTWDEMRNMMISGDVADAFLNLHYITASLAYNFSQTQPIFHINITGAYVSKPHAHVRLFLSRLDPHIFFCSAAAFGVVVIYYTCLYNVNRIYSKKEIKKEARVCQPRYDPSYLRYFLHQAWELGFALFGSCFSQGHVPQPSLFSGKILLFSWCMFTLTLTAIFKGHLASSLIKVNPAPPFTTFRELAHRTDYRWGHFTDSSFLPLMAAAKGNTLSELYSGMMRFMEDDPEIIAPSLQALLHKTANDERFVAIIDSFYLKEITHTQEIPYIKVIPDSLGTNGLAPALPRDSELTDLMSEHILALYETDIFNIILDNMIQRLETNVTHNTTLNATSNHGGEIPDKKENNKVDVMYGLIFSACLILVAILVLFLESSLVWAQSVLLSVGSNTSNQSSPVR